MSETTDAAENRPMSDERLAVLRAEVNRPSRYALEHDAKDMACELLAEVDRLRALLGKTRLEWGVRIFDHDPASATEVMSGKAMALEVAACWREEIEDSNPTLMQRTMRDEGQWCEAQA